MHKGTLQAHEDRKIWYGEYNYSAVLTLLLLKAEKL